MADEIIVETTSTEVVEVGVPGPQGPAGAAGTGLETLTTQGDTLYRGASTGERLPIGTTGQVLKVSAQGLPTWANESGAVTSVAGKTGVVTLDKNDVGLSNVSNTAQVTSVTGTAPIVSSGGTTPAISISAATTSAAGSMSSADKTKLDGIAAGAEVNVNADWNASSGDAQILNKPTLGGAAALNVGTTAGTVAAGDDARLSDSRTPSSHSSSHASAGSDPVFDQDLNTTDDVTFNTIEITDGAVGISANRWQSTSNNASIEFDDTSINLRGSLSIYNSDESGIAGLDAENLTEGRVYTLPDASGTLALTSDIPAIGTGSTEVAAGDHVHGNLTNDGKIGSTAGLPVVTTTSGAVTTLALGTAGQVLTVNSGATGVEFAAASGGGVTGAASSASDVLGVSGANITGVDATADRIVFWDDSASALKYLEVSTGLSLSGTTLTATASGGSKTYAVFTATDNQPPATAFATYDTRSSIAVLDFDDATDESAVFVSIIPEGASLGSGLKIRLHWMATTATSGNVVWDVSLERMTTDLDSDSFDTIASGTAAANGTSGILTVTEITLTTIDSVTAGDGFRLKVTRDANNASDTMTGDAELVVCEVRSAA